MRLFITIAANKCNNSIRCDTVLPMWSWALKQIYIWYPSPHTSVYTAQTWLVFFCRAARTKTICQAKAPLRQSARSFCKHSPLNNFPWHIKGSFWRCRKYVLSPRTLYPGHSGHNTVILIVSVERYHGWIRSEIDWNDKVTIKYFQIKKII